MIRAYTKKPVTITAVRYDGTNADEIAAWLATFGAVADHTEDGLIIHTWEGLMHAAPGWYVIRGVKDEAYPCEPSIFAMTYGDGKELPADYDPVRHADYYA